MESPHPGDPEQEESHFFKLPPEVRLLIYEFAIATTPPSYAYNLGHLPIRPSILSTCRTTRHEAMQTYFIHITSIFDFTRLALNIAAHEAAEAADKHRGGKFHTEKYTAYVSIQDKAVRASACRTLETRRLWKAGWQVEKWMIARLLAVGYTMEDLERHWSGKCACR